MTEQGSCPRGDACSFAHSAAERRQKPPEADFAAMSGMKRKQVALTPPPSPKRYNLILRHLQLQIYVTLRICNGRDKFLLTLLVKSFEGYLLNILNETYK
jgi:hypothetical protein